MEVGTQAGRQSPLMKTCCVFIAGDRLVRWRHSCTIVGDGQQVLVVGGIGEEGRVMDDILLLDTHSWKCDQVSAAR